jgi:hypothetical protein
MYTHERVEQSTVHEPVWLECRVTVDRGLFHRQYPGVTVNALSSLWPESELRQKVFQYAQKWIDDMKAQGYTLLTAEADIGFWGPFKHVNTSGAGAKSWTPAPGMAKTFRAFGGTERDDPYEDKADFLLKARFLASKRRMVEHAVR